MCYSAQVWESYNRYLRFHPHIDILEFVRLYGMRNQGAKLRIPLAMDIAFAEPKTKEERECKALIDAYIAQEKTRIEQEMFQQKQRLNDAERKLAVKETKAATDSKRIATDKISRARTRLADLTRTTLKDRDSRIYPATTRL